jgi:predicted RNA-binding Zn-ribbon protein involved in translation (DUF1610 family)
MPNFLALRCVECGRFQVQQQTKKAKFTCPVCGTSQSVLKVYATACRAKTVREVVATLNRQLGELELQDCNQAEDLDSALACGETEPRETADDWVGQASNMWNAFMSTSECSDPDVPTTDTGFTTVLPSQKKRKAHRCTVDHSEKGVRCTKASKGAAQEMRRPGALQAISVGPPVERPAAAHRCIGSRHPHVGPYYVSMASLKEERSQAWAASSAHAHKLESGSGKVGLDTLPDERGANGSRKGCKSGNPGSMFSTHDEVQNCSRSDSQAVGKSVAKVERSEDGAWSKFLPVNAGFSSENRGENFQEDSQSGLFVTAL